MCGIVGIVNLNKDALVNDELLKGMRDTLVHRGPDDKGILIRGNVGLGHRRLSIIDLSPRGRQPFQNEDGNIFLVMNGEVYNYIEIKKTLVKRGHKFYSDSDGEVILHGYEEFGMDILKQLRGMFAFGIYDRNEEKLFLARDRLGEKPLYYLFKNNCFYFASELKALMFLPDFNYSIDPSAIAHYLAIPYIPAPYTIFKNAKKLKLAHYLILDKHGNIEEYPYWFVNFKNKTKYNSVQEAAEHLRELLEETVRLEMRSDVPVAAMLSGGLDSSTIVSMMVKNTPLPINTFSIGYETEQIKDPEFYRANIISKKFCTNHTQIVFSDKDISYFTTLLKYLDEPFNVFPAIYSYVLLKEIRKREIKVVLSGNGADEIFLGYSGYNQAMRKYKQINFYHNAAKVIPDFFLNALSIASKGIGLRAGSVFERLKALGKMDKMQILANQYDTSLLRQNLLSTEYNDPIYKSSNLYLSALKQIEFDDFLDGKSYIDYMIYGHHGTAVISDVIGMANSVEIRSPFMDHKIVEFAACLPYTFKVKDYVDTNNKYVLKKMMETILPKEILYGKKMGFGYNIDYYTWMRGPWRRSCENILLHDCLRDCGIFNMEFIEKMWRKFLNNQESELDRFLLWGLIAFDLWYCVHISGLNCDGVFDAFTLSLGV